MGLGLEDIVRDYGREIGTYAAQQMLENAADDAPVKTGELAASGYGPEIIDVGNRFIYRIGFSAEQAEWTDQGTAPHTILPVRAEHLRFFWEDGPNGPGVYTLDQVSHPGSEGTGWFSQNTTEEAWALALEDETA